MNNFDAEISEFVEAMGAKFPGQVWSAERGSRYTRIVQRYPDGGPMGGGGNVHCFIERATGTVLKSAGWKGPAKGGRGSIATPAALAACVARADQFGGWLYVR